MQFKKRLHLFSTYKMYKKIDYHPIDKLRMFLDKTWDITFTNTFTKGVINIKNNISGINTKVLYNTLLLTDLDYVKELCENLIQRHERNLK